MYNYLKKLEKLDDKKSEQAFFVHATKTGEELLWMNGNVLALSEVCHTIEYSQHC